VLQIIGLIGAVYCLARLLAAPYSLPSGRTSQMVVATSVLGSIAIAFLTFLLVMAG
jgi:hypothetical protein